ncbi:MAG: class I SAM-dependent methyltransferase [Verrucomicrobia bacterium]|nr:class I SAM-dependent methyltransferase [Verrucomicrobiota bacterium]
MSASYHYEDNSHCPASAAVGMGYMLEKQAIRSVLDVGCGTGTWLRAALDAGVSEVAGVDGVYLDKGLHIPIESRSITDLTKPWNAGKRFDLVLCLEVAEHLPQSAANTLIDTLTAHADTIFFSAACPNQAGEGHLNCQWPQWWQGLFNERGFTCDDSIRWRWWHDSRIEPWYRQNCFRAHKNASTGKEPRIASVIHPDMFESVTDGLRNQILDQQITQIENGRLSWSWNLMLPFRSSVAKAQRWLKTES